MLNLQLSDTDEQKLIMHVDTIPPRDGQGLRLTCHTTMITVLTERLAVLPQLMQTKLTETSFKLVTRTVQKGRGNYFPFMYPARRQQQQQQESKNNLKLLQGFVKKARSQAIVPANPINTSKKPKTTLIIP